MALQLARRGITRVHPLEGGVEAWRGRGFPVDPVVAPAPPSATPGTTPTST